MRIKRSWLAAAASLGLATVIAVQTGCGWCARDTHLANQKVSVQPRPGDGSSRFTHLPEDPFKAQRGTAAAHLSGR